MILAWGPMAPGVDFLAVLRDFDPGGFGFYPVNVLDIVEVLRPHEGFDIAVVADAADVFFGFSD